MDAYLTFGLGFYVAACLFNLHTFKGAGFKSVARGFVIGILLWPAVILMFVFLMSIHEKD